jgi:predicted PurR-regulated permease PerM
MKKVELAPRTIVFTVFFLLGLYFVWLIRDLIYSLFIGFILMSALRPLVQILERKKIPHTAAVMTVYFTFILIFLILFSIVIPPIIIESASMTKNFPIIVSQLNPEIASLFKFESINKYLPDVTNQVFSLLGNVFSNTFFVITTLFFGLYLLLEEDVIKNFLLTFFEEKKIEGLSEVVENAEERMSGWFWGEITLMTVVGVMTFIGLNLIGMKYALPLAVLAGLLEVVPNVGPIISAIPAILIGFASSSFLGFSAAALYFVVQQLENNLIVPVIMKKAVGLNPIITLIALIVGGKLGGVVGVLLAIPAYLFIETVLIQLLKKNQLPEILR